MHKIPLNVCIPSPAKTHHKQSPLAGNQSLLYQTYDDYFNMEEDTSMKTPSLMSASSTSPSSLGSKNDIPTTPGTGFNEFFFVLSASSPCDTLSTLISPVKKGDIPDALLHLLPRPSNSLLDVVSFAKLSGSIKLPALENNSVPMLRTEPISHHAHGTSKNTPKIRPLPPIPILLRDSPAAVPMSMAFTKSSDIRTSSQVEITTIPLLLPKPPPSSIQNLVLKPLRQEDLIRVPIPQFASALRYRMRKRGRTDVVIPPLRREPLISSRSGSHSTGGRNSPFPVPIQLNFAPHSVPGSERTPYGYF